MYPVFFSVASPDIRFAEQVWERFPDDWVYLYSKTGEEGQHVWSEIDSDELPRAKILVVFWSRQYVRAEGCVREILQAKGLATRGLLRPLVLRLDDYPIVWQGSLGEDSRAVFEALGSMLDYRTSSPNVALQRAIELVLRVAEPILGADHPRMPRHELLQTLRGVVRKDRFNYYPAIWISGFNGVGRENLVRDFYRSFAPNARGIVLDVNEASLPKQIRLRIESEAFGSDHERLRQLNALSVDNEFKAVADTIERVFTGGNYIILRHSRIVEENVELPEWLDDVVNNLAPSSRPKLFIVSQLPLSTERRDRCRSNLVAQRVPTIDDHNMTEFCYQLIGHFDENPGRWTETEVGKIVHASGGTIGFLVSLIRSAAGIEDFDQIDQMKMADSHNMAESITAYVRWAFMQLRGFDDEQRTLLLLNDISPCDLVDIEKVISPTRPMLRVLGKLLNLGLVERDGENLYRLTPLLANRLTRDLVRPDLLIWLRNALVKFLKSPIDFYADGHEYFRIESRIQASFQADAEQLPDRVVEFVSAAHWFQAGIRLYHARRREPAYRILKKAFYHRNEFTTASRIELFRYYCLSATRNERYHETEECIQALSAIRQTESIAAFLRADLLEHQRKYLEAIAAYERSIELNIDRGSRLERTYRPLIWCILKSPRPDFSQAERYAKKSLQLRKTVFSLMALARVYLHWKYKGYEHGHETPENIDTLYEEALADLAGDAGVGSAHFEVKAEEARFSGDFRSAIAYMDKAIGADPRFELRAERWRLLANSGKTEFASQVLTELDSARHDANFRSNWRPFLPSLLETYAIALKRVGKPLALLNSFAPELSSDEIGPIVARVRRRDPQRY